MIELRGKREEIALAVKGIAPEWPVQLIEQLEPGEWCFVLNGVVVMMWILPGECLVCKKKADCPWTESEGCGCSSFEPNMGSSDKIVFHSWEDG